MVYNAIKQLQPYFYSLREVENCVSLDLKLPATWAYDSIISQFPDINLIVQQSTPENNLISIVSQSNEYGYEMVFNVAVKIIEKNKEEEQKQALFKKIVSDLQDLFQKASLDDIRNINFSQTNEKSDSASDGMARKGKKEGSKGDRHSQGENDSGDNVDG